MKPKSSEDLKDEQKQAILALLKQGLPSRDIAESLGVGKMVVAGYRAGQNRYKSKGATPQVGSHPTDWKKAQRKAAKVGKWAVTMTKVRIR